MGKQKNVFGVSGSFNPANVGNNFVKGSKPLKSKSC